MDDAVLVITFFFFLIKKHVFDYYRKYWVKLGEFLFGFLRENKTIYITDLISKKNYLKTNFSLSIFYPINVISYGRKIQS